MTKPFLIWSLIKEKKEDGTIRIFINWDMRITNKKIMKTPFHNLIKSLEEKIL